jgi:hypothetical protein
MRRLILSIAVVLPIADLALAQSTLILPMPGGGYQIVPPQGISTQVLPLPGGQGWMVIPTPGQQPSTVIVPATPGAPAGFPVAPGEVAQP